MSDLRLYPYILGLLVSCFVISANAATGICTLLLMEPLPRHQVADQLANEMEDPVAYSSSKEYSIEVRELNRIGLFLMSKKEGKNWFSEDYTEAGHPNAFQGDPRWNFAVFSSEQLQYFRITSFGSDHIAYPSTDVFVYLLSQINSRLEDKVAVGFERQTTKTSSGYLMNFYENAIIPIADERQSLMHYAHDMFFHIASVFLPSKYVIRLRQRAGMFLEFQAYIRSKHGSHLSEEHKALLKNMRNELVEDVDVATAMMALGSARYSDLMDYKKVPSTDTVDFISRYLRLFLGNLNSDDPLGLGIQLSSLSADYKEFLASESVQNQFTELLDKVAFEKLNDPNMLISELRTRKMSIDQAIESYRSTTKASPRR